MCSQWHELADLYLSVGQYKHAAFCYEDLILADPMSYLLHCRLAEILYTMGGHDNFLAARKYFSQSLHLKKSNPRALFGLAQCTQALSKTKLAKVDAEVNSAVQAYASEAPVPSKLCPMQLAKLKKLVPCRESRASCRQAKHATSPTKHDVRRLRLHAWQYLCLHAWHISGPAGLC